MSKPINQRSANILLHIGIERCDREVVDDALRAGADPDCTLVSVGAEEERDSLKPQSLYLFAASRSIQSKSMLDIFRRLHHHKPRPKWSVDLAEMEASSASPDDFEEWLISIMDSHPLVLAIRWFISQNYDEFDNCASWKECTIDRNVTEMAEILRHSGDMDFAGLEDRLGPLGLVCLEKESYSDPLSAGEFAASLHMMLDALEGYPEKARKACTIPLGNGGPIDNLLPDGDDMSGLMEDFIVRVAEYGAPINQDLGDGTTYVNEMEFMPSLHRKLLALGNVDMANESPILAHGKPKL